MKFVKHLFILAATALIVFLSLAYLMPAESTDMVWKTILFLVCIGIVGAIAGELTRRAVEESNGLPSTIMGAFAGLCGFFGVVTLHNPKWLHQENGELFAIITIGIVLSSSIFSALVVKKW